MLFESGFIDKWVTDLIKKHTLDSQRRKMAEATARGELVKSDEGTLSLTVHHLQGVFFVYAAGLLLASILLLLEIIFRNDLMDFLTKSY
ncbi:hypothetical protein SK128_012675 [Halocaridina rubra]|uniref:Uncharacterized protein n=1 Tax=Halocaridina rubra TaxID=373956 RepID=A0AAN8X6N1_HALRR